MIRVYVKKQSNYPVSVPKIKRVLRELLVSQGIVSDADLSVTFVGEKKIIELAKKYLHEGNVVHNVLAFPFLETRDKFIEPPGSVIHLGDIVVCYPKLVAEANKEGKLIDQKAIELVSHAALHLLGKHHE